MVSFFHTLKNGLSKSTQKFTQILSGQKLDEETLEALEDELIAADLGPKTASEAIARFRKIAPSGAEITTEQLKETLASVLAETLRPLEVPFALQENKKPHIVLMVGVNGTGKTTTSGKLAAQYAAQGKKTYLAAADTFRAAAIEQLQTWGARANVPVITGKMNGDPAAVAYDALDQAIKAQADLLIIDTAGRLHNKNTLMEELAKIIRVMQKLVPDAPHSVLLTLDAVTGQNALDQVRIFRDLVHVTGLIITKIDGTARGGIVAALATEDSALPVHFVGFGEKLEDLRPFKADLYAKGLVGLETPEENLQSETIPEPEPAEKENSPQPSENVLPPSATPKKNPLENSMTSETSSPKEPKKTETTPETKSSGTHETSETERSDENTETTDEMKPEKKKGFFRSLFR